MITDKLPRIKLLIQTPRAIAKIATAL